MAEYNQRSLVSADAAETVSQIIHARRMRANLFSPELFADAAWDIMLALFLAQLRQGTMTTSDVGNATTVPMAAALRWITTLDRKGWIRQKPDPSDQDHTFVELSPPGSAAMQEWVDNWMQSQSKRADDSRVSDLLTRIDRGRRES